MPNIIYYSDRSGREFGTWPGISKRVSVIKNGVPSNEPRKTGQKRLGLVVDKEKLIFFKNGQGFYQFHPEDQSCTDVAPEDLPVYMQKTDARRRNKPVIVQFGGSYFLDCLIKGIDYNRVLESIAYQNMDRLYAMLDYYLLANGAASAAETWYEFNYAKFLYPKANLAGQRISEFYASIGTDENRRNFLLSHIKYLLKSTDEELCILVDSTGMPNKCRIPYTRVSNHDGDVNIEFRVIVVVQKSTGLPVYYEMIPGNVVDISTLSNVMRKLQNYGYTVSYALGDAAYSCPANIEKLVLAGIDFLTRLNPTYDLFAKAYEEHYQELDRHSNEVLFHNRIVSIVKIEMEIAREKDTGESINGYVYLCRDQNARHSKSINLMNSRRFKTMKPDQISKELDKYGVFALISTKDMPANDILKEYYMRQGIEQFFDYAKNYADYLPVRNHNVDTLKGHLMMGFIATFFLVLIKNKLNILDNHYVAVPNSLKDEMDDTPYAEVDTQQGAELIIRQEKQMEIFKGSPSVLFSELQFQMADVFDHEIVPAVQVSGATQFYKAYHIGVPEYIMLEGKEKKPVPVYKEGEGNNCTRRIAFTRRSTLTPEQLEEKRKKGDLKKLEKLAEKYDRKIVEKEENAQNITTVKQAPKKRGPGRPPGSRNKKTLAREALEKASKKPVVKRKRGRPKGSKNKSTLAKEAAVGKGVKSQKIDAEHQQKNT